MSNRRKARIEKVIAVFWLPAFATVSALPQQGDFQKPTGPYLGQKPPGMTPEAQIISRAWTHHHGPGWNSAP